MNRLTKIIFLILLENVIATGQTSNVTATITDPDGQTWNNGSVQIILVPNQIQPRPPVWSGGALNQKFTASMNGSGTFTVSIPDNNFITPSGSMWQFTLCSNTSAPCQNVVVPVTGPNPNLSSTLSSQIVAARFGNGAFAYGYTDAEVITPVQPGGSYFNVASNVTRQWNGSAWISITPGGIPGGSPTQIQINNSGAFGGISNVAAGSALVSNGPSALPIFQTKPVIDVRDFGVTGNGITDDTAAIQSAINAGCGSTLGTFPGAQIIIPKTFNIRVSSTLNFNNCGGVLFDGGSSTGQAGFSALITWAGGSGGTVFAINRTRDSIFRNFSIQALNSSNIYNIGFDIDENSGSGITSHDLFQNLLIGGLPGGTQNTNFIGVRIGQNAPGNTEQQIFDNVVVGCGGGTITDTSNGRGFLINPGNNNAQPFYVLIKSAEVLGCSHGIEIAHNTRQVIIDGGNYGPNFHSLDLIGGTGVVFENIVTTLDVSSSVFLNGYSGVLEVRNNDFTGAGANVIDLTNASGGAKVTIEDNDFGGAGMLTGSLNPGSYTGYLYIKGNTNFTTPCPSQSNSFATFYRNIPTSGNCDEMYIGTPGSMAFDFASRNDGVNNSPPVRFEGTYQNSATPTFAADYWQWQDVIGAGTNGTSTYTLTHSGTTGTLQVAMNSPNLTLSGVGLGNGQLSLSGNTSGTANFTAPAVAGTSTNAVAMTNVLAGPNGTGASPTFQQSGGNQGMYFATVGGGSGLVLAASGADEFGVSNAGTGVFTNSANCYGFTSGAISAAADTALCRQAAGVAEIGTAAGNSQGKLKAAGYMSAGTTFTSNAGCGDTTLTGGATAGKYTSVTAGTCTTIITMGNSATAPNGWSCTATDLTTAADAGNIHQTATSTTTASLNEGTVVANDVIQFSCIGY